MKNIMNEYSLEHGLSRMHKIWASQNEKANSLGVRVTATGRQENERTLPAMTRSLVQKKNAISNGLERYLLNELRKKLST